MGSSEFSIPSLRILLEKKDEVLAAFTQPPRPAGRGKKLRQVPLAEYALSKNIPVHQPVNFFCKDTVKKLKNYEPDIIVVISYGLNEIENLKLFRLESTYLAWADFIRKKI